ncbi:MAG: TetR/AcrR family transcriptional regulator [Parvularculaceae bacterium]|nr:TetR/AcrR family transcriptional regulator [Parvularculaceae bacterium]
MAKQQRAESTRALLLRGFRAAFLERGFEETTTQFVLDQTGLSKGAMYHHFRSKNDIVEALYADESRGAIERAVGRIDQAAPPLEQLKAACLAWTEEVRSPSVSKVLFEIGPAALGPSRAKEIEDSISLDRIQGLLDAAVSQGDFRSMDTRLIAAFLNALVAEASWHARRTQTDPNPVLSDAIDGLFSAYKPKG